MGTFQVTCLLASMIICASGQVPPPHRVPRLAASFASAIMPQAEVSSDYAPSPQEPTANAAIPAIEAPAPALVLQAVPEPVPAPTPTPPSPTPSPTPMPSVLPSPPPPSPPPSPPSPVLAPLPKTPPFPLGFASAAYQFEGAYLEDGKGLNIWDVHTNHPELLPKDLRVHANHTGNVACDFYHRYDEDLTLAKELSASQYRISIAWARIYPNGDGAINQAGIDHYVKVVDNMLAKDITPVVTLYHWDLPQALQDRFGGWNSEQIVPIFAQYAATMFKALGEKIMYWSSINEPKTFCWEGYGNGLHAPGIKDPEQTVNCSMNVLKAHAAAAKEFRKIVPGGQISMNLNAETSLPYDPHSELDKAAAQRKMDFEVGLFADPIYFGQFPDSARARLPTLPEISPELAKDLAGSLDYFALNHYTSSYVKHKPGAQCPLGTSDYDVPGNHIGKDGHVLGVLGDSGWLYSVPFGFRSVLNYVNDRYHPVAISITENGFNVKGEDEAFMKMEDILNDKMRIQYFKEYIHSAFEAFAYDKVPIKSYFAWALMDNFEWQDGYSKNFGVMHVDFNGGTLKRTKKASARFLADLFIDAPKG